MYTTESVNQLVAQLEQKMRTLMQSGDYKNAVVCGTALDKLVEWQERGQTDDLPRELQTIPDVDWQSILQRNQPAPAAAVSAEAATVVETPTPSTIPAQAEPEPPAVVAPPRLSQRVNEALTKIENLIREGNLPEARAQLELVTQEGVSADAQQAIDDVWERLRARERQVLDEAVRQANALRQSQPNNYDAQKEAWRAVLRIDPNHQETARELSRLDALVSQHKVYQDLLEIRRQIPEIKTRLSLVETARRRVDEMRYDILLQDPEIKVQVNDLYEELDEYRKDIYRKSEGGVSSEKSEQYDQAIIKYRDAIRAGYVEILDDTTGGMTDPSIRLREAIKKRNAFQISRSSQRFAEAEKSLLDGKPETAIVRLEEALKFLEVVEVGGDELRRKVEQELEEARISLANKQSAYNYVQQSDNTINPQQARTLLLQARDIYPSYPGLSGRIRIKEEQLLDQIQVDMRADLSRVEALLNERKFDEARRQAEEMLRRGRDLDFISKETTFQEARQKAEALLDRINVAQRDDQRFQERIRSIEAALAIPDVRLARSLLDAIPPEQMGREEVGTLRLRISQMSSDSQKWQDAQRAFEQGLYEQIADLVEALVYSPRYQEQAAALQTRAQIRLLAQEARQCETKGELTQAREIYHRILEFRGVVADDQPLIEQARQDLTRLDGSIAQGARYKKRLDEVAEMRIQLRWPQWLEKLKALEQDAGHVLETDLRAERRAGLTKWEGDAVERVKEIQMFKDDGRWREAYALLHPLYTEGVFDDKHEDYQRVAYNYHRYEAELRKSSQTPQELEMRVDHLRSLLRFAAPPAIKEKEELTQAIRNWALRHAQFTAADSNPTNAVKALEDILNNNRYELKEDADIWGYLVYYALQARNFERATSAAGVIGFIPGQENLARAWHQVVNGIKAFSSGKSPADWAAGVSGIADARRMGVSNKLLVDSLDKFAVQLADQLYAQVSSSAGDLTNESILSRVRIYALMLQLNPEDSRAKARIDELAGRLNQISRDVMDRFKRLGDNPLTPEQEVAQLEAMGGEMEALVNAAAQLSEQQGATTQQLRTTLDRVKDRKTNLQSYMRLSKDLEERYRESLSKSWDTAGLISALTELQRAARQAEINRQSSEWDEKIRNLIDVINHLESRLDQLEKSWISEAYADVLTQCDELDAALRSGQSTLSDRSLVIPAHRIDLYNEYEKSPLNSVAAVRAAAQANKRDMDQWNQWCDRYDNLDDRCVRAQEAVERKLKEHCLSEAKSLIDAHIQALTEIVEQVGRMPKEARSKTTKDLRDKYAAHRQGEDPQAVIEQQRQKRAEIEAQIAELEPLLRRLRLFASGNVNWGNEVGRTAFRKLADPIYQIDACNPDLKKWLDLYEKKTGRKYP